MALRLQAEGGKLAMGQRRVSHPVRPAPWWVSLRLQAGNRDDVLMAALHGRRWQGDDAPGGRRRRHLLTTACGVMGLAGMAMRRSPVWRAGLAGWAVGTTELALARIAPGPRTPAELGAMVLTSVALPPVASWHWLAARATRRGVLKKPGPTPEPSASSQLA